MSVWKKYCLNDLCRKITDGSHNPPKGIEYGAFLMLSSKNIFNDAINYDNPRYLNEEDYFSENKRTQVEFDDILLTIVGTIGRVAVVPEYHIPFTLQRSVAVLKPKFELIFSRFLMFSLQNILEHLVNESRGVAQKGIYLKQLREIEIYIPSLKEQQQIVALLDEAFAAIDQAKANIEKNIQNAKELFQSKLNAIFSQKGDGWEEKTLGELGKVSMCKRILKNQTAPQGDIPFYKIGTFGKSPDAFIPKDIYEEYRRKYSFPKVGDILISASGTIGRRVVYDGEPAFFQDSNIVWIDNHEELVLNEYLYQFYGVCDWNPSKGATINRLYNDDLRRIKISFPNKEEQKNLIKIMKDLSENTKSIESYYRQKNDNLLVLKKSILQKAFAGELKLEKVNVA
ncbi:MAG: hypothetical protein RL108_1229 [Bacteroidota bacterium]|jgi:type I restriction enzyme S subunit